LRARRIDAYSEFAEKVMEWRRAQTTRMRRRLDVGPDAQDYDNLRMESHQGRSQAWSAFYKVKLLCDDPGIEQFAFSAIEATSDMSHSRSRTDLNAKARLVSDKLDHFLEIAAGQAVPVSVRGKVERRQLS
jgi:hypothetical protein